MICDKCRDTGIYNNPETRYDEMCICLIEQRRAERRARTLASCGLEPQDRARYSAPWRGDISPQAAIMAKAADAFVKSIRPDNTQDTEIARPFLVYLGNPGNGKSHLAVQITMRLADAGREILYTTPDELMRMLRTAIQASQRQDGRATESADDMLERFAKEIAVFVFDDVREDHFRTDWSAGIIETVIGLRYRLNLATVVCSNLLGESKEPNTPVLPYRIGSRFTDAEVSRLIVCADPDRRPDVKRLRAGA